MRDRLLFDEPGRGAKLTAYWTLLLLAAVIASAGVVSDSTATVIGAMIVAPLMTPILGIVLAVAIGDGRSLSLCLALTVTGALAVVVVGYLVGLAAEVPVTAETSSQVAGRVSPRLIDLVAAIATGAVGAFALVRSDVSDTLPGVAIAISLVPPLAVVGLTLEAEQGGQAWGALLLFLTNVGAILLTGLAVMALYRVSRSATRADAPSRSSSRGATILVVVFVVALSVPLAGSTARIVDERLRVADVEGVATAWAAPAGWEVVSVEPRQGAIVVRAVGELPSPEPQALRGALDGAGLAGVDVCLELIPQATVELPASD
jgi:uncharacterized hydrophobic protein (TIGR00271 family)